MFADGVFLYDGHTTNNIFCQYLKIRKGGCAPERPTATRERTAVEEKTNIFFSDDEDSAKTAFHAFSGRTSFIGRNERGRAVSAFAERKAPKLLAAAATVAVASCLFFSGWWLSGLRAPSTDAVKAAATASSVMRNGFETPDAERTRERIAGYMAAVVFAAKGAEDSAAAETAGRIMSDPASTLFFVETAEELYGRGVPYAEALGGAFSAVMSASSVPDSESASETSETAAGDSGAPGTTAR